MSAGLVTVAVSGIGNLQFWSSDGTTGGTLSPIGPADVLQATAAKQDTGNTSLGTIATASAAQATSAKQDTGNTSLATIATASGTQATAAKQDTGNTSLASLVTGVNLASGENHVGQVGGHIVIAVGGTLTRPANVTAYAIGDLIANSATAGSVTPISLSVARANDKTGMVRRLRLKTTDTGFSGVTVRAHLYQDTPTVSNGDNGAWLSIASGYLGYCDIVMDRVFSDAIMGIGAPAVGGEVNFAPHSGAQTISALLEVRAAVTPSANSTTFILSAETHQN